MTKKEAITKIFKKYNVPTSNPFFFEILEVLEQEPVFDKIRDEIKGMYRVILKGTPKDDWAVRWNDCLDEVLVIIDKYREEEINVRS